MTLPHCKGGVAPSVCVQVCDHETYTKLGMPDRNVWVVKIAPLSLTFSAWAGGLWYLFCVCVCVCVCVCMSVCYKSIHRYTAEHVYTTTWIISTGLHWNLNNFNILKPLLSRVRILFTHLGHWLFDMCSYMCIYGDNNPPHTAPTQ